MTKLLMEEILKLTGLQLGKRNIKETDRFLEDLGAESADIANLIARVEEKYGITVKESEIAGVRTPADLFTLVQKHLT